MRLLHAFLFLVFSASLIARAEDLPPEIYCTIRENGQSLNCTWMGKDKKTMSADDVASFVDQSAVLSYVTVKSKAGMERTFQPDPKSLPYKRLSDIRKSGSASETLRAKLDVFSEIEKRVIKLSNDLDTQAQQADVVKFDASVTGDKMRRELRDSVKELEQFRKQKGNLCTSTPEFEALSKTNGTLQTTLSNILVAFQSPGTCMENFKVFKDKDGTVDLRQLEGVGKQFAESCKKK